MKIQFDHQIFSQQIYGGISRYFTELIKRINEENEFSVGTIFSNNVYLTKDIYPCLKPFLPNNHFRGKLKILNYVNKLESLKKIKKSDFDIFHPTYFDDYFMKNLGNKPFVITIYDMIHEKFNQKYFGSNSSRKIIIQKKKLAEKATKIIAISNKTKMDIIDIFDIDEKKIDVVYLGNSLINNSTAQKRIIDFDYILYVGNRSSYKNFDGLLKVLPYLFSNNNLKLICAGGGDFNLNESNYIKSLGLTDKVLSVSKINDDILSNLYANALFFIFPSLYEGFGIPIIESFHCGCPVLSSNCGSLPEIGGEAALYFDPYNQQSFFDTASNLINNELLRNELKLKGTERIKNFSWDKTFQQTLNVYKSVI